MVTNMHIRQAQGAWGAVYPKKSFLYGPPHEKDHPDRTAGNDGGTAPLAQGTALFVAGIGR